MKKTLASFIFLTISLFALAVEPLIYSDENLGAIKGVDPVAYFYLSEGEAAVQGLTEFTYEWEGAIWYFSSSDNLKKFQANPDKYIPQYGGYCAFAVSHNFTKPVDPDFWRIIEGKLYLNLSNEVQEKWLKDVSGNINRADKNWPKLLN